MIVMSVDVETTGLSPANSNLLSVGVVIFNPGTSTFIPLFCADWYIKQDHLRGHPRAILMNTEIIRKCCSDIALHVQDVSDQLHNCMSKYGVPNVVLAGKNFASFDDRFLSKFVPKWDFMRATYSGHRILDPGSMFFRVSDVKPPDLETCCQRAGVPYSADEAHNALYDATLVAKCIYAFCNKK